jgi:hypothetical protein
MGPRVRGDDTVIEDASMAAIDAYEATASGGFPSFFPSARFRTTT